MLDGMNIIAVVPARSGSKGVPGKNIRKLAGVSLIGHAGRCLSALDWIDARVISTDSAQYAEEGRKYGLDAPFMRPSELSGDKSSAIDTMKHALKASDEYYQCTFDILLIVEPTSPMRKPSDIEQAVRMLIDTGADSVVSVSPVSTKYHPKKILRLSRSKLEFYEQTGKDVVNRQQLNDLYIRNGVCYALRRECVMELSAIFTQNTRPYIIERELANIDEPIDFLWAEFLIRHHDESD